MCMDCLNYVVCYKDPRTAALVEKLQLPSKYTGPHSYLPIYVNQKIALLLNHVILHNLPLGFLKITDKVKNETVKFLSDDHYCHHLLEL